MSELSHLQARYGLLKIKSFRVYTISCILASFGNALSYVAMIWFLLKGEHQLTSVSLLMACFWIPNIIWGPLNGVLVDKYNRKHLLLICNISRAIIFGFFGLLYDSAPPASSIYILGFLSGSILSLHIPSAMTFVREIVTKENLLYANTTINMAYQIGTMVGMASAGLIIALTSMQTIFVINAIFYCFASYCLMRVITLKQVENKAKKEPVMQSILLAINYLTNNPTLLTIYLVQTLFFVSYMTVPIILAPFAKSVLHTDAGEFGLIEGAMAVGSLIGGLLSPYLCVTFGFIRVVFYETLLCSMCFYFF